MTADLQKTLVKHLQAENAHDLQGTLATLTSNCVFRDHATGQCWHGHAGAADHYRQWWDSFDVQVTRSDGQEAHWLGASTYVAEATWVGTHIGNYLGIAPTGRTIRQPFTVFVRFDQGLLSGEVFYYDIASLLRQLGEERVPDIARLPHRAVA